MEQRCLVKSDGDGSMLREEKVMVEKRQEEEDGREEEMITGYKQMNNYADKMKSKKIQEKVDVVAIYVFPTIFVIFNVCYWIYYLIL